MSYKYIAKDTNGSILFTETTVQRAVDSVVAHLTAGCYMSFDGGETWKESEDPISVVRRAMHGKSDISVMFSSDRATGFISLTKLQTNSKADVTKKNEQNKSKSCEKETTIGAQMNTDTLSFIKDKILQLEGKISPSSLDEDGRINSIFDEKQIIDLLIKQYGEKNVIKQKPKHWFDVSFYGIPLQIKSSSFGNGASDNFSSKKAILWALTNFTIEQVSKAPMEWSKFDELLLKNLKELPGRDYPILVFDKDERKFHTLSIRTLQVLTPNGSNLPFQINWQKNQKSILRDYEEAKNFILSAYKESARRAVKRHEGILNYDE